MNLLVLFAYVWQKRFYILIPLILCPIIIVAWSLGKTPVYHATTTLHLDPENVQSPLIRNITNPEHSDILQRYVTNPLVIEDTLKDNGILSAAPSLSDDAESKKALEQYNLDKHNMIKAFRRNISVGAISADLIRIELRSKEAHSIEQVLESLKNNFVDEVLAPERLRIQRHLGELESQIKRYNERQKLAQQSLAHAQNVDVPEGDEKLQQNTLRRVVSLEFEVQRLEAQRLLAKEEYDRTLARANNLSSSDKDAPGAVLWMVEEPMLISSEKGIAQAVTDGIWFGFLIGLFLMFIARLTDTSLRRDEEIVKHFGLKILGHMPNLGDVTIEKAGLVMAAKAKAAS